MVLQILETFLSWTVEGYRFSFFVFLYCINDFKNTNKLKIFGKWRALVYTYILLYQKKITWYHSVEKVAFSLDQKCMGVLQAQYKSALRGGKKLYDLFFFTGPSATKRWEKSRIFRYGGVAFGFLSKGQKNTTVGGVHI